MFNRAKSIDKAFRQTRLFMIFVIILSTGITLYALYRSFNTSAIANERIYILANGKILEALAAERKDNIDIEARDHVRMFHHYFFSLDPDEQVIQANIKKALYLADNTAWQQYGNLKENNYYSNIISGNISQSIQVDSIQVETTDYPYFFRFYGKQEIMRPTSLLLRRLITEGYIRNIARSDNNPHGFLIEKWKTIANTDITTEAR